MKIMRCLSIVSASKCVYNFSEYLTLSCKKKNLSACLFFGLTTKLCILTLNLMQESVWVSALTQQNCFDAVGIANLMHALSPHICVQHQKPYTKTLYAYSNFCSTC